MAQSDVITPDTEFLLSRGNQRALVSPFGASLRRYFEIVRDGVEQDIAWGYSGGAGKKGGQGDVLAPFPGRIKNGRYAFNGKNFQLPCNDKDGPNAIHGFVRTLPWQVLEKGTASAEFRFQLSKEKFEEKGFPFPLELRVRYELQPRGLACGFRIRNTGNEPAPAGIGFHPYFTAGTETIDESETSIPSEKYLEFENLIPTGRILPVAGSDVDFRKFRKIGTTRFNHCFTALTRGRDGHARCALKDPRTGRTVTVWMDETFPYLVIYTGDTIPAPHARRSLAIEPMSCATDALNRPEWGLRTLKPDQIFEGNFGVSLD